jgi:hypothetical protein
MTYIVSLCSSYEKPPADPRSGHGARVRLPPDDRSSLGAGAPGGRSRWKTTGMALGKGVALEIFRKTCGFMMLTVFVDQFC